MRKSFHVCFLTGVLLHCSPLSPLAQAQEPRLSILTLGQSVARTLSGGEQQSYQLVLTAGQYLRLSVEQQHIDVVVTLVGPEGKKLLEVDSPYGYLGPEVVDWIAATAGTYRVEILSPEKNVPTGRYIVQLEALRPATAADQQRMLAAQAQTAGEQAEAEKKAAAFSQALQHYETAARLWQEVGAPLAVATAYFRLGGTARQLQDTPAALAYYEKAAQLHRAANNRTGEAFVDFERGRLYSDRKEPRKAIQALTAALTHFQATLHRQGEAATRLMLGILCKQLNERAQALTHYQELLRLSRELKHRGWEAASLNNLGALYLETGEKQKAGEALTQALQVSRQNRDRMGEASALNGLGSYYHHLGELQKALEHYQLSLQLRREMKDRVSEATTLSNLVALYDSLGEAQKMLDASAQVLQLPNTPQGRAWALSNIGRAYDRLGLPQEALRYYEQSLPLARAQGDQLTEARAINYIGLAHWSLGEQTVALAHFQQALPLFQAAKNPDGEAGVLNNLGLVYKALKQWPQALQAYQQALPLFRASRDRPFEAAALYSLGLVYEQLGERAKALEYQQRSLELSRATGDPRRVAKACYGLARLERAQGKLSQARQHIEQSIAYVELLRAKLDSPELRAAFRASTQEYYDLYIDVLMRQHWRQTGKPRAGNQLAAAALQANERARARSLIEMLSEANTNLRQSVDAALLERERTVQNQLNDKTTEQLRLLSDAAAASQAETLRQAIAQLTAELRDTQAEIRRRSPQYAALTQPEPLTVPALQQQLLAPNTLLLEYALGEERSYLWAVTSTSLHAYALPKRAIIEAAARRFYESLTTRNQAVASETAATRLAQAEDNTAGIALSYLLLRPVAAQLNNQRLLIVADGALQYVPFAALPEPGIGSRWPVAGQKTSSKPVTGIRPPTTDYRPLLVRHEIVTLPSASTLASLRRVSAGRTAATKLAAVLADPVFEVKDERVKQTAPDLPQPARAVTKPEPGNLVPADTARLLFLQAAKSKEPQATGIPRLPQTRREAEAILTLAGVEQSRSFFDFAANRATVLSTELSRYRILHFATHGFLNSENPALSGLVLSLVDETGKTQNGFLLAPEIYQLKLPATELVVLSACQTGLGQEVRGEGVVGLTRGFMYAGAPRVVVSLWNVSDEATAELMRQFYEAMLRQGLRPAAALRAAQLALWRERKWHAPYYWAAFTLQGEWR